MEVVTGRAVVGSGFINSVLNQSSSGFTELKALGKVKLGKTEGDSSVWRLQSS